MKATVLLFVFLVSIASMASSNDWSALSADSILDSDFYTAGIVFYEQGDTVRAARCFQKGAKAGDVGSKYIYGLLRIGGFGVKEDKKAGLRMIREAAKSGEPKALCFLGRLYENGEYGCPVDKSEALELYRKASQAGNLNGSIACGNMYLASGDTIAAVGYWAKAVEEANPYFVADEQRDALAQVTYNLGLLCQYGIHQGSCDAADYYQLSVEYGNTKEAAFQLGLIYLVGESESGPDLELAARYFKMAATAGQREAYPYMGDIMRFSGDDEQALLFYLEGARYSDLDAMCSLAEMYYERGEYDSAAYWAYRCPDSLQALYLLGWIYYSQQDTLQARHFWKQCVYRFHHADALTMLKKLASEETECYGTFNGLIETKQDNTNL